MSILPLLGLVLITIAWSFQLKLVFKDKKEFDFRFLIVYAVGSFALAYAGFQAVNYISAVLSLAIGLIALVMGYQIKG
jgi:hypothetical protein|tara:strand:+ start:3114 stop:3347 length:234 start_codon:yes stop_codon:yes gene_type:complete